MGKHKNNYSKFTEFFSDYQAYRPALKKYFGRVTTAIVVNQLERRFGSRPDGFYKFLKPCEHPLYRLNDSWCEELGFTEKEFRSAFDGVGHRYKSKGQLEAALRDGKNPFQGKLYLSYKDTSTNLTYFLRFHIEAERVFSEIVNQYQSHEDPLFYLSEQEAKEYLKVAKEQHQKILTSLGNAHRSFSNCPKVISSEPKSSGSNLPKVTSEFIAGDSNCPKGISGTDERSSPNLPRGISGTAERAAPILHNLTRQHKTTQNLGKQNIEDRKQSEVQGCFFDLVKNKKAKMEELGAIGKTLTDEQELHLQQWLAFVSKSSAYRISAPQVLFTEVRQTLLDLAQFNRCENDFFRKLCAIDKILLSGKWRTPYSKKTKSCEKNVSRETTEPTHGALNSKIKDIDYAIRMLDSELKYDLTFMGRLNHFDKEAEENDGLLKTIHKQSEQHKEKIKTLVAQKKELLAAINDLKS